MKQHETPPRTGWNNGLCQDYERKLSLWFASRLDAREVVRRWFGYQRIRACPPA